eukprot:CAMPEP_0206454404 /NCGR_PEP_ID=MMETSP0324_2-20121206/21116_1 /ASSEMBLY_ACC=CAM_ASM_000836 /TAXON_ID=2866 /ORGANISM="Crypthecodinium cohnii, Strain Seligo" /LENGTH=246 /DNA_ID=CAMNT_0053924869 /DNA_START=113 /DNA_END=853 /DNA_ORIENTATION=+
MKSKGQMLKQTLKDEDEMMKQTLNDKDEWLKQTRKDKVEMMKQALKDKEVEMMKQALKDKDEMMKILKDKDEMMKQTLKDKDEMMKQTLKDKDEWLKQTLKDKDKIVLLMEKELLQAKGIFTARGVFEFFTKMAHSELVLQSCPISQKFIATETLRYLGQKENQTWFRNNPDSGGAYIWCRRILDAYSKCQAKCGNSSGLTLAEMYAHLSQDIHGRPWNKDSIALNNDLNPFVRCVISSLAENVGW